ncbi:MAG: hypothetical protein JNM84_12245 [Planctomycetes bacterium]|nr:hypothetical protein [Planctomycetota bacterium]
MPTFLAFGPGCRPALICFVSALAGLPGARAQTVEVLAPSAAADLERRVESRWAELVANDAPVGLAASASSAPPAPQAALASTAELGIALRRNRLHFSACEAARLAGERELSTPRGCAAAAALGERALAAYAIGEDRILVSETFSEQAERLLRLYPSALPPSDPLAIEALLDVVLWHELAHAVQDRAHDLARLGAAARGFEARAALSAVIEGHAQLSARHLASSPRHRAAFEVLARSHEEAPVAVAPSSLRAVAACEAGFAYRAGLLFCAELARQSSAGELLSRAFHSPPTTLWHVEHPRAWLAGEADPGQRFEDPLRAFAGAGFERERWASTLENATRESLRRALSALDPVRVERVVGAVLGSRVLHVRERTGQERLLFAVLDLGSEALAAEFIAAEEEASRRFDAQQQEEPALALRASYARRGEDGALWIVKQSRDTSGSVERSGLLLARSGSLVIELNVLGATSEERARALALELAARLR